MFIRKELKNRGVSKIRQMINSAPKNSINLGLGEIQLDMHPKIKDYVKSLIDTEKIFYTPNGGLSSLRREIASYYQNKITEDDICVTVGAEEAVFATLFSILNKDDEVIISNPGYLAYKTIIELCNGKPVFFDRNKEFELDKKSVEKTISSKTKALIISNPSNPLGIKLLDEELIFLKDVADKNKILLIIDEIYRDLALDEPIETALDNSKNVIIISGISKAFAMSGWRLGWLASSNKDLMKSVVTAHQYIATCAPYISQKIAEQLLSQKDFFVNYHLDRLKKNYDYTLNFFQNNLPNIKMLIPDVAPYLFVNFAKDDQTFAKNLLKKGVIVIPGSAFGKAGSNWVRINYAVPQNQLEKALDIIKSMI